MKTVETFAKRLIQLEKLYFTEFDAIGLAERFDEISSLHPTLNYLENSAENTLLFKKLYVPVRFLEAIISLNNIRIGLGRVVRSMTPKEASGIYLFESGKSDAGKVTIDRNTWRPEVIIINGLPCLQLEGTFSYDSLAAIYNLFVHGEKAKAYETILKSWNFDIDAYYSDGTIIPS